MTGKWLYILTNANHFLKMPRGNELWIELYLLLIIPFFRGNNKKKVSPTFQKREQNLIVPFLIDAHARLTLQKVSVSEGTIMNFTFKELKVTDI